jgi:hypothetical protein
MSYSIKIKNHKKNVPLQVVSESGEYWLFHHFVVVFFSGGVLYM